MTTPFSRASSSSSAASQRLVSSHCPECGAPVDFRRIPPDQPQVECSYCGTLIAIPGRSPSRDATSAASAAASAATLVVSSDGKVVKGGWGCSSALWGVIILIIALGAIGGWSMNVFTTATRATATRVVSDVVQNDSSSDLPGGQGFTLPTIALPLAPKPRLATAPLLLGGDDRAATQLVIAAYQNEGSLFIGFDTLQQAETWRSPLLSERYYEMGLSADGERVYVADGATLMALDRSDGQILWQTSLANHIQTGCNERAPCLQQAGAQMVALARDGTVQGFAGATGMSLWSRRLNSQPRQFLVNNDQVILVDNDDSNRAVVLALNAANGDVIHELRPTCTFPNIEMRPHASDQYVITPDGSALLVVSSGSYACAWRYDLVDGTLTWSYTPDGVHSPLPFTWSMSSLTIADPVIYFINEEGDATQIYALDSQVAGATPQLLYEVEEHELTLREPLGDLLLVSAVPSFARDEVELWAISRSTGERRWQRKLETTHTFDEWVTQPTGTGLFVAVCSWHDDDCRFEVLDLVTGTSKGQVHVVAGTPFSGAAWRGNEGFLTIDGKLYAIDLRSATVAYTWP